MDIDNTVQELPVSTFPLLHEEEVSQNQYYISLKYHPAKGTDIIGSFHYLRTKFFAENPNIQQTQGQRGYSPPPLYNISENSFVGALAVSKRLNYFKMEAASSFSNLNNKIQIQPSLSLSILPFGNLGLYSKTSISYHINIINKMREYNPVITQNIGVRIFKYFYLEPSISFGKMINFTDKNAFVVNDDNDLTSFRFENMLNISLFKRKFNVFFLYRYNIKENTYILNSNTMTQHYINQSIIGGIKWYF